MRRRMVERNSKNRWCKNSHGAKLKVDDKCCIATFSKRYLNKYGAVYDERYMNYQYCMPDENIIIGCPDFIDNNNYIGHIINDIYKHKNTEESIKKYKRLAKQCNAILYNCCKYNLFVPVLADRDIAKDEEIFVSYGLQYWQNYNKSGQ
jgi:hypothetical protein